MHSVHESVRARGRMQAHDVLVEVLAAEDAVVDESIRATLAATWVRHFCCVRLPELWRLRTADVLVESRSCIVVSLQHVTSCKP